MVWQQVRQQESPRHGLVPPCLPWEMCCITYPPCLTPGRNWTIQICPQNTTNNLRSSSSHFSQNPCLILCASIAAAKTLKFLSPSALLALEHFQGEQHLGIQQSLTIFLIYLAFGHDVTTWVSACFASTLWYPAKDAFYRHLHGSAGRKLRTAQNVTSHG